MTPNITGNKKALLFLTLLTLSLMKGFTSQNPNSWGMKIPEASTRLEINLNTFDIAYILDFA